MKYSKIFFLSLLLFSFIFISVVNAQKKNSCVDCHQKLPHDTFIGENYVKWQHSVHSEAGITCDRCHGGIPDKLTRQEAHVGIYNSSNPKSKVYYKNVPRTCGSCHMMEYKAFKTSVHYEELERKGLGPTCVSCHGSKAASIVTPDQISEICTRCHNPRKQIRPEVPTLAYHALYLMGVTEVILSWSEDFYRMAKPGAGKKAAKPYLDKARKFYTEAIDSWHTFDVDRVLRFLHQSIDNAKKSKEKLQ